MNKYLYRRSLLSIWFILLIPHLALSEMDRFIPQQGDTTEIWRITNNPGQRDWANYHNTEAWSPDGRYICYESFAKNNEIHIYDLHKDTDIKVDNGTHPRWANNSNLLFYIRNSDGSGITEVICMDIDTGNGSLSDKD